jgi:histidine triad (HIT) family protein
MSGADSCPFCAIVAGERPATLVFEDAVSIAFLDHRPLFPGHVLLVPREHHATFEALPPSRVGPFFANAQRLARAVEVALEAQGSFVALNNRVSQSVPHLHVHIVPRNRGDGLRGFFWPRRGYEGEPHRHRVAEAIRRAVASLGK